MLFEDDNDTPPTSKEEAAARSVRPPPEKYDPDQLPYWSLTMTLAWIIWRDIDHVRDERDDYLNECADWLFRSDDPSARARVGRILIANITGQTNDPDPKKAARKKAALKKDIKKSLQDLQEGSWHLCSKEPSRWKTMRAPLEQKRSALKALCRAAGDGKVKTTALAYEHVKAYLNDPYAGDPIDEIPVGHWAYLNPDPSGRPIFLGPGGRVYRDVQFHRLGVKEQWPPLSAEPIEPATVVVQPEPAEPKAKPTPESKQQKRAERYIAKNYPKGTDGVSPSVIYRILKKDTELGAELEKDDVYKNVPSLATINRVLGLRTK